LTYYRLSDAVKAIPPELIGITPHEGEELDVTQQSARLKKAQADKTELEVEELRGSLVRADAVSDMWDSLVMVFRAKMLTMPSAICAVLVGLSLREIEAELRGYVRSALAELGGEFESRNGKSAGKDDVARRGVGGPAARVDGQ
jgi:phage terminase Nu1 subunit (DNA packaging protein)